MRGVLATAEPEPIELEFFLVGLGVTLDPNPVFFLVVFQVRAAFHEPSQSLELVLPSCKLGFLLLEREFLLSHDSSFLSDFLTMATELLG